MKRIKLIDLFIKIANGEDTPKKIEFQGDIYSHNGDTGNSYYYCRETNKLLEDVFVFEQLNDEVEIIEDTPKEDKKIEKLDLSDWWEITSSEDCKPEMLANIFNKNAKAFSRKINEIIDYIKKKEK